MIFETSYLNKEFDYESDLQLGKSFGILDKLKLGGVGSSRMVIEKYSSSILPNSIQVPDINYGSIELRPKGILVHFTNQLNRYSWIIPYYRLVIFSTDYFSIHANGQFISFRKDNFYKANTKFIAKMNDLKSAAVDFSYPI